MGIDPWSALNQLADNTPTGLARSLPDNIVLIVGILGSLALAAVALYRARPQRDLDAVSKDKVENDIKVALEKYDRDKTVRIMRLENYITRDVIYHRQNERYQEKQNAYQAQLLSLLERFIDIQNGDVPQPPGEPPEPPELPDLQLQ